MKTDQIVCPCCNSDDVEPYVYEDTVPFKGQEIRAKGLLSTICHACKYDFCTHEQHDANIDLLRALSTQS